MTKMENFTEIFGDNGDLDLELGREAFPTPPGPVPVTVAEMDINSYSQTFTHLNAAATAPQISNQAAITKHPLPTSQPPSQPTPSNSYQFRSPLPHQQAVNQFPGGQYRPSYPTPDIYSNTPVLTNSTVQSSWHNQNDQFCHMTGGYQQGNYQVTGSNPQSSVSQYQNSPQQTSVHISKSFQSIPPLNVDQNYATSCTVIYQNASQPFQKFDEQHPNYSGMCPPQPQQYTPGQNLRQSYQPAQYSQNSQVTSHMPIIQATQVVGQISSDRAQINSGQLLNGPATAYQAPFPQVSPQMNSHAQVPSHPQGSPMPSCGSPLPSTATSLCASNVSSPGPSTISPAPSSGGCVSSSISQTEVILPDRTLTVTSCSTPNQSVQSPSIYGSAVLSPVGQCGALSPGMSSRNIQNALSPGMITQARPPTSPQHWQPGRSVSGVQQNSMPGSNLSKKTSANQGGRRISDNIILSSNSDNLNISELEKSKIGTSHSSDEPFNNLNNTEAKLNSHVSSISCLSNGLASSDSVAVSNSINMQNISSDSSMLDMQTNSQVSNGSLIENQFHSSIANSTVSVLPVIGSDSFNSVVTQNSNLSSQTVSNSAMYSQVNAGIRTSVASNAKVIASISPNSNVISHTASNSNVSQSAANPSMISHPGIMHPVQNTGLLTQPGYPQEPYKQMSTNTSFCPQPQNFSSQEVSSQAMQIPSNLCGHMPNQVPHTHIQAPVCPPMSMTIATMETGQIRPSHPMGPTMQIPIRPGSIDQRPPMSSPPVGQIPLQPQVNYMYEIQQCQQQLQHLYKLPQNMQTQQKISDVQHRLTTLQQQHQSVLQSQGQGLYGAQHAEREDSTGKGKKKSISKPKQVKAKSPKVPKEDKPKKEPKPKKDAKPKEPKTPKKPRSPKPPKEVKAIKSQKLKKSATAGASGKKSKKKETDNKILPIDSGTGAPPAALMNSVIPSGLPANSAKVDPITSVPVKPKSEKKPKVKNSTPSKKKPSAKFSISIKKKKKRSASESDYSEGEGGTVIPEGSTEDDVNKRRSGRNTGSRKKYIDELDINLSDDESLFLKNPDAPDTPATAAQFAAAYTGDGSLFDGSGVTGDFKPNFAYVDPNAEDSMVVQCIMSSRIGERECLETDGEDEVEKTLAEMDGARGKATKSKKIEVKEFFVKYRGLSYLHCEWHTEDELLKGDRRIQGKIKRFKQKRAASQNIMDFLEEEPFNPDYTEIDRVLDFTRTTEPVSGAVTHHYLVKWKSLPYEDATWELEDDIDPLKIKAYLDYKDPPQKSEWKQKKHPRPNEWKKLEASPMYKNNNSLREYQLEGHNCILADEMGLGKTIQALAFIQCVYDYGIRGPFLIIAPLSTIPNWQREFETWTDLNVIVYHGSQASRSIILEYEMYYKDENGERIANLYKFHVLITTFEVIISDCIELKEIQWRCCIIDEAHRLKNRNCKLLEGLRIMLLEQRLLLSGTPLQNNVNELFSLLNFLEPSQFSSQEAFLVEFGKLETEEQVKKLQAILKPMMLRRMKEDVEKSLAPKEETIIEVELTNIQKKYYRAILERNFDFLVKGATYTNVPSLMNTMMELRKCCLHPYLLNGAEEAIQQDYKETYAQAEIDSYHNALVQSSGKMVLVDKLLPRLKETGHRVLVFSQMVKLLDILEDYMIYRKYPYERLDGRIRGNLRQAAIDRFCKPDSDRFVFLLCTKAGGLGINLTAADTVIIYDSDWNPQNDLQAQARCHRIGQLKSVKIYRLLCRNTYEREMFDKASLKLGLDKAVLQSMNTDQGKINAAGGNSLGLSKKDIEDLLKKGAYGALMDEDNQEDQFCEEDIDQILSRRTTVIQLESEKGSTFSKASFAASSNRSDIDIDDPEFWSKWAKKVEIDTELMAKKKQLIMDEPRRRSQIRRYGHDEAILECSDLESSESDSEIDKDQGDDLLVELGRLRSRGRGRGRGRGSRGPRGGRLTRSSRWLMDEDLDPDNVKYGYWHRSECFKVEKGLLTYGWGRWKEILLTGDFRPAWKISDIEDCGRMVLLYCIRYYRGDEKIKAFIFDLIAPTEDGKTRVHHNHAGLSAPVPRGRKGKKKLREAKLVASHMEGADWAKEERYDTEIYLDQGYSRHLTRHSNKVLLRVRLLFYIKQEIIGDLCDQIDTGTKVSDLLINPPPTDLPPKPWWDAESDRALLIGVYKHGYERYNVMRNDPTLCFLTRCGPPDKAALMAELNATISEDDFEKDDKDDDKDDDDSNQTPLPSSPAVSCSTNKSDDDKAEKESGSEKKYFSFPSSSDLNGRLRRLVTSYQRNNKKLEMRNEGKGFDHFLADRLLRRERMAEYNRERELRKADYNQRRWANQEQKEFYRTISTFGVEYIRKEKRYDWTKFRILSRLEKKYDETLTEYFRAFMAMCKKQCGIRLSEGEYEKIMEIGVDRLPEERARRVLERVDLLNRLRNDILPHSGLKNALKLSLPSKDLPHWWIPGKYDLDLLKGVARHGLGRTDYYILHDPDLCFREILRRHTAGEPLITENEKAELQRKYFPSENDDKEPCDQEKSENSDKNESNKKENVDNEGKVESGVILKDENVKKETPSKEEEESKREKNEEKIDTDLKSEEVKEGDEVKKIKAEPKELEEKECVKDTDKNNSIDNTSKESIKEEKIVKTTIETAKEEKANSPLLSLQQMDEAIAKYGASIAYDSLVSSEPTVAQLLAQSAANPIKWPKDSIIQVRIDHIMYAVEHNKWPVDINYQTGDQESNKSYSGFSSDSDNIFLESKRRQMEDLHRAQLQALIHPNLHQTLGLSKGSNSAVAAAALGLHQSLSHSTIRSLLETNTGSKKFDAFSGVDSSTLRHLQALHGSLDLSIRSSVDSSQSLDLMTLLGRRPGRPKLDDIARSTYQKRSVDSVIVSGQDKKRKKLDDIVQGLQPHKLGFDSHSLVDPLALLKGSTSVTLERAKDRASSSSASSTKLVSSVSITPSSIKRTIDGDAKEESGVKKSGLVRDLPPGISLPPGIELYRPSTSSSDSKVDKWLEQHQGLLASGDKSCKKLKLDSSVDSNMLSGEEHVPVINPSTNQKITGSSAPKLKCLAKWLIDHPGFEVDPHWGGLKEGSNPLMDLKKIGSHNASDRKTKSFSSPSSSTATSSHLSKGLSSFNSKNLLGLDPKLLFDPTLLAGLDPKLAFGFDPKMLSNKDLKMLASLGLDPKLLGIDLKQQKGETSKSESKSQKQSESKPGSFDGKKSSQDTTGLPGLDPKLLAGLDPKLLAGLDPKLLASLDPKFLPALDPRFLAGLDAKSLGFDPKLFGIDQGFDPKLLGLDPKLFGVDPKLYAGLDPKLLSMDPKTLAGLGIDPTLMMMAGFGALPGMSALGLSGHMFPGLPNFNLGTLNSEGSSKSKDQRSSPSVSQANLFSNMFAGSLGGAAGLMYPLGFDALSSLQMSPVSSASLLNGLAMASSASEKESNSSYNKGDKSKVKESIKTSSYKSVDENETPSNKEQSTVVVMGETNGSPSTDISQEERKHDANDDS